MVCFHASSFHSAGDGMMKDRDHRFVSACVNWITWCGILSEKKICASRLFVTPAPWDSGSKKPYTSLCYSTHSWSTSMEASSCTMSMLQATQWMTAQIISSTNPDLQYCVSHESSWISSPDFELVGRIRVQTMYSYFTRLVITTLSRLSMLFMLQGQKMDISKQIPW